MTPAKRLTLVLLALCLTAGWLGRGRVVTLVARHLLLPMVVARLPGLQLGFADLDTNLVSRMRVNGLSASYCLAGVCQRLNVPQAQLTFALSELLSPRGKGSQPSLFALTLQGARIEGEIPSTATPPTLNLPPLPALPAIRLVDSTLILRAGSLSIDAQGLDLSAPAFAPAGEGTYVLELQAQRATATGTGVALPAGPLTTTISLRPGRVEVPELFFQQRLLLDHGVVEETDHALHLAMNLYLLQSEGQVRATLRGPEAALSFQLAEGNLKAWTGVAGVTPKVSGHLQAQGEFTMTMGQPETLEGSLTAFASDGSWNGIPVERLEIAARAHDQVVAVERLSLAIGGNRLTVRNGRLPMPQLKKQDWLALLATGQGQAEISVTQPETLPPAWSAPWLKDWQELGLTLLTAELSLGQGHVLIPKAHAEGQAGQALVTGGDLDLSGPLTDGEEIPARFTWQLKLQDAAVVRQFWEPWPASGGKAHGQGSFSGTLADPHLPFTATFAGATLYGVHLGQVEGELEWTKDRLALQVEAKNGPHDRLSYSGTIDLKQGGLINTQVTTELDDIHPYLPQALIGNTLLSGPLTGSATLAGPFSRVTGQLQASGDWRVDGVGLSGATVEAGIDGWQWDIQRFVATLDQGVTIDAQGQIAGRAGRGHSTVSLATLALDYQDERLELLAPGVVTIAAGKVVVQEALTLAGKAGEFRVRGALGEGDGLTISAHELRDSGLLRRLTGKEMGFDSLGFTLKLNGVPRALAWRWQATVAGLAMTGAPFALAGRFDLSSDAQGLWLREGRLSNQDHAITLTGHLPLTWRGGQLTTLAAPLELQGTLDLPRGGLLTRLFPEVLAESGTVHADLKLAGSWEQPRGQVSIMAEGLKPGPRLAMLPGGPFQVAGLLALERERLRIEQGELTSAALALRLSGSIGELPWAELIQGRVDPIPGVVEVAGRYELPDLGWLAAKVPGLRRSAGQAKGAFRLAGPLAHPQVRADLALRGGEARAREIALVVRGLTMDATLGNGQLTISKLSGTLGGSPVQGGGRVLELFSADPGFDLKLSGKDLLLYRADGVKIRADTTLALAGSWVRPELSGEILLTDSRITKRVDWLSLLRPGGRKPLDTGFTLFSFKEPPWKNTHLNLRLQAVRPLAIANNFFKGGVRPDLLLTGSGEVPYLLGVVFSDSGTLTLPAGRLDLERGLIRFSEDDPDRPQLETQATGRMMGYDITAQVRGPYDEPEVTLSSSPPLSSDDLLMLLLTGRPPLAAGSGGVSTVAVYLGRGLLSRLFGEELDSALLLDRLEVDVGRAVTQQGEPTVDARVKLADGLWRQGTSLYLTGEKDTWDYYNVGLRMVVHFR